MRSEIRSCVKDEVDVLDSLSLIVLVVSVDVKRYYKKKNGRRSKLFMSKHAVNSHYGMTYQNVIKWHRQMIPKTHCTSAWYNTIQYD